MASLHHSYTHYWQARKKRDQLRYERKRRGWLVKLLRQARARGLPRTAQLPELDAELRGDAVGSVTRRVAAAATLAIEEAAGADEPAAAAGADGAAVAGADGVAAAARNGGAEEAEAAGGAAGGGVVVVATAEGIAAEARELEGWNVGWETANVSQWREELGAMQAASAALEACVAPPGRESAAAQGRACADDGDITALSTAQETRKRRKHEHYARLFRLPVLIDETLSTWIDPADNLSDKQACAWHVHVHVHGIFHVHVHVHGIDDLSDKRVYLALLAWHIPCPCPCAWHRRPAR